MTLKQRARRWLGLEEPAPSDIIALNRHQLGSIDLSNLEVPDLTPEARKQYVASVSSAFTRFADRDIRRLIQAQLEFIGQHAANWDQSMVGRGTINGLALLHEKWKAEHEEHLENIRPPAPREFDPHYPFPETTP